MRLLVLGGTSFVGRAIAEEAVERGHELTLFSRGQTGSDLFPGVERRVGDRAAGDYASLADGSWDAVIDVSGYVPRHVTEAAAALDAAAVDTWSGRYLFISTVSVYDGADPGGELDEDAPRLVAERSTEKIDGASYGPLKVACEDDLLARFGPRATIVRPGIVAGPWDPTDRFTYWARRAAKGGRVALTGRPDQPVQVVDSRDLARLVVTLIEGDVAGTYNAVGPEEAVTLAGLITACATAAGAEVEIAEVTATGTPPRLPLILDDPAEDVMFRRSAARARSVGLTATPLATTAADVLAWDRGRGTPPLSVGPTEEQEAELLAGG